MTSRKPTRPPAPLDQLLTIPQVAEMAHVSRRTVYNWINSGLLERVDIGSGKPKTRISRTSLAQFFGARTIPARRAA